MRAKTSDRKKLAFIYTRVSDSRQVENTSLASQEEAARRKAIQEGYTEVIIFIEEGRSASKAFEARTEFNRMLTECKARSTEVGAVIVWKYDRFCRDNYQFCKAKHLLTSLGIKLISCIEPSSDTIAGGIVEGIMATMAEAESRNISLRSITRVRRIREQGRLSGPAPVGLLNAKRKEGEREVKVVVPDVQHVLLLSSELSSCSLLGHTPRLRSSSSLTLWGSLCRAPESPCSPHD